jgi:hypothetical protein
VPLRPLSLTEILDGGFQAMRTNPRTMIGIAAVVLAVTSLITIPVQAALRTWLGAGTGAIDQANPSSVLELELNLVLPSVPSLLLVGLATTVLSAMLVVAVSSAVLGERTPPGELWRRVRRRVPAAVGLAVVTYVLGAVVIGLPVAGLGALTVVLVLNQQIAFAVIVGFLTLIAFVVLAIGFGVFTSMAAPALLLENLGILASLRRSWRLLRGSFWRTLLTLFVAYLLQSLASALVVFPFSAFAALLDFATGNGQHTSFGANLVYATVTAVGQIAGGAVLTPWWAAVVALIYIDLRMRREGLDLELIRAADARSVS